MSKLRAAKSDGSPLGSVMAAGLIIAGIAIAVWGVSVLFSGRADGVSQFVLSLVLGGGLAGIGFFMVRGRLAQRQNIAWLEQHGTSITMKPVLVRTIKTDSALHAVSYCLVLAPGEQDMERYDLNGVTFETNEIFARSVPDNYRDLRIEVIIDPERPDEVYFVNFAAQDWFQPSNQQGT